MADRPLVSICTPTWQRRELLTAAHANIRRQTYSNLEHVIVSEGPDPELREWIDSRGLFIEHAPLRLVDVRYVELGRNWTTYLENCRHAAPMMVAQLMASGDYQTWLADDERMEPDHIERLVHLLEETGADFVYSMTQMWHIDAPDRPWIIGTDPPRHGQVTNVLYRARLLEKGLTRFGAGFAPDWDQISQWIDNGATWAFLPEVTFTHRADL